MQMTKGKKDVLGFGGRIFGAHTSIAGGVVKSIERAVACGFSGAQIFVKSNHQWSATSFDPAEIREFREARDRAGILVFGHTGYLINLGGKEAAKADKSLQSLVLETERAEALGLPFMVLHPGSHGGDGEEIGLQRIARQLNVWADKTRGLKVKIALESTAGTGGHLGYKLEHLRTLLAAVEQPERFGVCLDTAHLFAAGYPIHEPDGYQAFVKEFLRVVGKKWILAFHVNDTPCLLGSRKDRHEHLGKGRIGLQTFQWLVQDKTWEKIPMILETPKSEDMHEDVENLGKLKAFLTADYADFRR
jgi:deoxyribonuclease-4